MWTFILHQQHQSRRHQVPTNESKEFDHGKDKNGQKERAETGKAKTKHAQCVTNCDAKMHKWKMRCTLSQHAVPAC